MKAVCIGECMVELRPVEDGLYARAFAGDAYNTAVYLKRNLGEPHEVAFLTALGDDAVSADMTEAFKSEGLAVDRVAALPGRTPGLYLIELDERGDRNFLYWRGQSAARDWLKGLLAAGGAESFAGLDLVYLSGISLAILSPEDRDAALVLLSALRGRVGCIAFDPNLRPRLWEDLATARIVIEAAASAADILLPSDQDGRLLWDLTDPAQQLRRWTGLGPSEVALTAAEAGAWLQWDGAELYVPAVRPRQVVDTSGAGDSFNGAYLAARLLGAPPEAAGQAGVRQAAAVIATRGALLPRG